MNRERLKHTARKVLPFVKDEHFKMNVWACKTAACAFGSEALSDFGRKEGLWVRRGLTSQTGSGEVSFGDFSGVDAAACYYGVDRDTAEWIVAPSRYVDDDTIAGLSDNITPAIVAARIESLLACGE